jgi:hypothetical protein
VDGSGNVSEFGCSGTVAIRTGGSRGTGRSLTVSRQAIAAALAREDMPVGERLVAFSLASFDNGENRAWPGAPAAAARAGLKRSRYLEARDQLVRGGLVYV